MFTDQVTYRDIAQIVEEKFPEFAGTVEEDSTFDDLDFDSLVLVELGVALTNRYGVRIEEEHMLSAETFKGAADVVNRLREESTQTDSLAS